MTWSEVLAGWRNDESFLEFFTALLKDCRFHCFRFETPPLTESETRRPFEFVLIDAPEIDLPADSRDFQGHFERDHANVLVFDNLGGDATMIVPRPRPGMPGYPHIAGFVRHAPFEQQRQLWRVVAETLARVLESRPLWLNTAGGGVPWLHVRIDTHPKYYVYEPYRAVPGA